MGSVPTKWGLSPRCLFGWGLFNAEARCARAEGIGSPERSEPEGPQGAASRRGRRAGRGDCPQSPVIDGDRPREYTAAAA